MAIRELRMKRPMLGFTATMNYTWSFSYFTKQVERALGVKMGAQTCTMYQNLIPISINMIQTAPKLDHYKCYAKFKIYTTKSISSSKVK